MSLLAQLLSILAPVFICAAVGFVWGRLKKPFDTAMVGQIVVLISTPCLVFDTLAKAKVDIAALGTVLAATIAYWITMSVASLLVLRLARLPPSTWLPSLVFSNAGNMGLPVALFAYGETGLALGIAWFTLHSIGMFAFSPGIMAGNWSVLQALRTPTIHAALLALLCIVAGITPPLWISNTTQLIGSLAIPLLLMSLGVSLAGLRVTRPHVTLGLVALRMLGGTAVGFLVAWALDLDGALRGIVVLMSGMPPAVFNYMFALQYGRDPQDVASLVVASTLASTVILPLVLLLLLS